MRGLKPIPVPVRVMLHFSSKKALEVDHIEPKDFGGASSINTY